ncbi:DUF6065 family protein [Siccirubricoccus sp. KC 17139]|uniref:DUF6065 family protein n=1 Tax=Siccirubricoccus soli TaxID=2899147 RepID=A0ABT1D211_9PROT|nr:DUF6065 family protein [Siccirubricoccus soli]MCO6415956.1 DUF6065 family protein [Siccirubricoccus soli]MCP2682088.1 DUF6065 family protein [Siccirubricoccus soli]
MTTATAPSPGIVTFYRLIDGTRAPERADRSGLGSLPTRALRYCDAVTQAAGFGWHVYPAMDFSLLWDGAQIWWHCEGLEEWSPLGAAQFPHFAQRFDQAAPAAVRGYSPPFLTALQEPGVVQMWTGLAARTAPGWSLLVRPMANLPRHPGYEPYEGIVECDRWFGPLFTNLRLTRTDTPIRFHANEPVLQVQPIPQVAYADAVLNNSGLVEELGAFSAADWADYQRDIVAPNQDPAHQQGRYAAEGRKRRRAGLCPHMAAAMAAAQAAGQALAGQPAA